MAPTALVSSPLPAAKSTTSRTQKPRPTRGRALPTRALRRSTQRAASPQPPKTNAAPKTKNKKNGTSSKKRTRKPNNIVNLSPKTKRARKTVVVDWANKFMTELQGNARVANYGQADEMLKDAQRTNPWITRDQIYGRISYVKKKDKKNTLSFVANIEEKAAEHTQAPIADLHGKSEESIDSMTGARWLYYHCKHQMKALDTRLTPIKMSEMILDILHSAYDDLGDFDHRIFHDDIWNLLAQHCKNKKKEFYGPLWDRAEGLVEDEDCSLSALIDVAFEDEYQKNPFPMPCALLDAHDSRLQVPFLRYINEEVSYGTVERPRWKVCIGLPNGTHEWQVGDSEQQNGKWKTTITREKDALIEWKGRNGMDAVIEAHDIVPLVNIAWDAAFADKENNLKATRDRGWQHLDQRLLKKPHIVRKHKTANMAAKHSSPDTPSEVNVSNADDVSPISFNSFNLQEGLAGDYTSDFFQYITKNKAIQEKAKERYEKAKVEQGRLDWAKKLSGGNMFKAGHIHLDNECLQIREYKENKKTEGRSTVIRNAIKTYMKYRQAYDELVKLSKSPETYGGKEHKTVIRMLKRKDDEAVPKSASDVKKMYLTMKDRPLPSLEMYLLEKGYPRDEFEPLIVEVQNEDAVVDVLQPLPALPPPSHANVSQIPPPSRAKNEPIPTKPSKILPRNHPTKLLQPPRPRRSAAKKGADKVARALATGGMDTENFVGEEC